jgi:hypothetical protein
MRTPLARMESSAAGVEHQPSSVRLFLACPTRLHGHHGYFAQTTTRGPPVMSGLIPQKTV